MLDPQIAQSLEYTSHREVMNRLKLDRGGNPTSRVIKGKPDWTGRPGSPFEGHFLDLTTRDQVPHHLDPDRGKIYGENLLIFTYDRPP